LLIYAAERRRIEGNDLFKDADAAAAATVYRMALMFLDEDLLMQLEGPHLTKARLAPIPVAGMFAVQSGMYGV
jgi:hypothetical protein